MLRLPIRLGLVLVALVAVPAGKAFETLHAAAAPDRPRPGVHTAGFTSTALRGTVRYAVYLPKGYAISGRRYPVVYLLHGLPADATAYRNPRISVLGAMADRRGKPVIVVAAQGARAGDTDPEWHDWGPGRNWETATSVELVRTIDARYRTVADPRGRALIGISAGGYGAALIGLHHPETYGVIQSWSGYFHPTNAAGTAPVSVGTDHDNEVAGAHSYVSCMARLDASDRPLLFGFYVGDQDARFLSENRQLDAELTKAGVPHLFRVYRGAHDDGFWDRHEESWLLQGVRLLSSSAPADGRDPQERRDAARRAGCPMG